MQARIYFYQKLAGFKMTFKKVVSLVTLIALLLYILGLFFPMDLEKEPIDESFGFTA